MASNASLLIRLGELLVIVGVSAGLGVLISNLLRVRDMRGSLILVVATVLIGFAPFIDRMIVLESYAYQRDDGTFVPPEKVGPADLESGKIARVMLDPRALLQSGSDVVLAADNKIKVEQQWQFRPGNWTKALKLGIDLAGGTNLIYQAKPLAEGEAISSDVMTRLVGAVTKRVNPSGTNEVVVRQVGQDRIEIIVPGADPAAVEDVKNKITRLGNLEFSIVLNASDHGKSPTKAVFDVIGAAKANPDARVIRDPTDPNVIVAEWFPVAPIRDEAGQESPNTSFEQTRRERPEFADSVRQRKDKPPGYYEVLLLRLPEDQRVTGQFLSSSKAAVDNEGRPAVEFNFNGEGAHRFSEVTRENKSTGPVHRLLAVVLDGQVYSAPKVEAVIHHSGIIHGSFTQKEVEDLVGVLNAGALPVELIKEPVSEFTISPTLGADVKQKGMLALWVSAVVVVVFMAAYYLIAGFVADIAMLLNLLFIAACMALLDAAFTLPGLAGLVLGAGMAVDANVLIYERIREEQQRGASLRMAIHNGFDRAMGAIVDSNLTTIITAIILYAIGTEQVKGFAVALFIGLVMNLFTAVYVSRVILTAMERGRVVKSLPMLQMIGKTSIDFLALRWPTAIGSLVLIVAGLAAFVSRGDRNYDIDFNGGTMVTMLFNQDMETDEIRNSMAGVKEFGGDIALERLTLPGEAAQGTQGRRFRLRTVNQDQKLVERRIAETFPDKLVRYELEFGEIKSLAATPKAENKAEGDKANEKKADEKKDAKPADLAAEIYAGGSQVTLSIRSQNELADVAPSTIERYLAEQLTQLGLKEPATLFTLEGLQGKGTAAAEGQVKLYHTLRLLASKAIPKEQLSAALASAKTAMQQRPIFDEVTTFATSVAQETKMWAVIAMLLSLVAIVIYIWFRFETVIFGIAAIVALAHDVLVALGCLALASYLSQTPLGPVLLLTEFKINMAIIAAFLTIVGYSINDTIVIFDRLREIRGKAPTINRDMINLSVNQCLSRTILTSLTVFLTVMILYALGGEGIHGFAFCMLIGTIAGSYSTVFIANPIVLWLTERWSAKPSPSARFGRPAAA